jgi:TRAP-type mannitol/chloroaromatic compound transport system substrate-binding protein
MKRREFITKAGLGAAGVAGAGALATPAIASGHKTMIIVSTWGRDFPGLGTSAQRLAARITELSEGSITTEYFAGGERVAPFDVFDEVASGNSQAYIAADYYWRGTHPGFAYFTAVPMGMNSAEWNAWIRFAGGQELWDEISGQYGLKALPAGSTGCQAGGWFNKEINSADDLKGLKMRIPGLGGTVMSKLGASPISVPGSQIYENLVSGAIDACEWVGPWNDYFLKFYEAAKYYYTAGMHEPGSNLCLGMNASWWGSLSQHEKNIIHTCCYEENGYQYMETMANNGAYLTKLVEEQGVEVKNFNEDVWDSFGEAAEEVFAETRDHSALAAKINDHYQNAMREIGGMNALFETNYINQRNRILGLEV